MLIDEFYRTSYKIKLTLEQDRCSKGSKRGIPELLPAISLPIRAARDSEIYYMRKSFLSIFFCYANSHGLFGRL